MTMKDSDAKMTIGRNVRKSFNVLQEVRQGDDFSAVLFNLALDKVLKELKWNGNTLYKSKQACAHADDIALIARNTPALQKMYFNNLTRNWVKYGLYITEKKTKYMKMTATHSDKLL